jgi:hypothetical protein
VTRSASIYEAAKAYREQVARIRDTLANPVAVHRARAAISELVGGRIKLTPAHSRDHLVAEINLDQIALLRVAGVDNKLVAGAGYDCTLPPVTLRRR